jgi:hypothetical protein
MLTLSDRVQGEQLEDTPQYLVSRAPVSQVFKYDQPGTFFNLVEPEKMFTSSNTIGQNYQVGVRTTTISTLLYYFTDVGKFTFAGDVNGKCTAYDISFGTGPQKG